MSKVAFAAPMRSVEGRLDKATSPGMWRAALVTDPRQAIQEDTIRCLICGRTFRQLTNTHLGAHGLRSAEYKRRFGYNRCRPLMCRALQRLYAERAVRTGLAAQIRSRPILVNPELRARGGVRQIAFEEWLTRREARLRPLVTVSRSQASVAARRSRRNSLTAWRPTPDGRNSLPRNGRSKQRCRKSAKRTPQRISSSTALEPTRLFAGSSTAPYRPADTSGG